MELFNGSNTDGSFTMDDSNSFFSLYKILPIAQENKYLMFLFSYYIMQLFNGSNTDGSFTMDDSNSFFSPYKILPIAQ